MIFYIASSWKNKARVDEVAALLYAAGFQTNQRWTSRGDEEDWGTQAEDDLADIEAADALLLLNEGEPSVGGGMHFEAGFAYAQGKKVLVIGPRTTVFHALLPGFPTIEEFLKEVPPRAVSSSRPRYAY